MRPHGAKRRRCSAQGGRKLPGSTCFTKGDCAVADIQGIPTEFPEYDFTAGDFLGEVPLLLRTPVFNSARAQTPCRIARLDKQQFFQLIRDSKEARAMVLEVLGERLLRIQERSLSLMTSRVLIFGRNRDADCHNIRALGYLWFEQRFLAGSKPLCGGHSAESEFLHKSAILSRPTR